MARELSFEEIERLRALPVSDERSGLVCPDCGALMVLKVGKFGRFYGCRTWGETGCRGSHKADLTTGAPRGVPAKARVRDLRKRVLRAAENFDNTGFPLPKLPNGCVAEWGETECIQALRALGGPVTRYDLLNLDGDAVDFLLDDPQ